MDFKDCYFVNQHINSYVNSLSTGGLLQLQSKFQEIKAQASSDYQVALYTDLGSVAKKIQFLGYDKEFCSIYGIYSFSIGKKQTHKFLLTLIRIFEQNQLIQNMNMNEKQKTKNILPKTKGITLIYFNQAASIRKKIFFKTETEVENDIIDFMEFSQFKNQILKKLPIAYLTQLRKIVVSHPGFLNKSLSYIPSFGSYNGLLQKFIQLADSIYQLCVNLGPLFNCESISKRVLSFDRGKLWKNIYTESQKVKSLQELSYFQMSSTQLQENQQKQKFYLQRIQDYELNSRHIPKLLKALFKQIETKHSLFEGIFRKACDQVELLQMEKQILMATKNKNKIKDILQKYQAQTISSCIKKIFFNLKSPIIPYEIYEKIVALEQKDMKFTDKYKKVQNNVQKYCGLVNSVHINVVQTSIDNKQSKLSDQKKTMFMKNRQFFQNLSKNNQNDCKNYLTKCINMKGKNKQKSQKKLQYTTCQLNLKENQCDKGLPTNSNSFDKEQPKLKLIFDAMKGTNQYEVFKYSLKFLSKVILTNQKHNLMSAYNLAVVFVPCFFRSRKENYKELMMSSKFVQVLKILIKNYHQVFQE